jgi:hypothetical protein
MSRLRTRLERLERRQPPPGCIRWDNLLARSPEEIVPDGIVDWHALFSAAPPDNDPIEEMIRLAELPAGEPTGPPAPDGKSAE